MLNVYATTFNSAQKHNADTKLHATPWYYSVYNYMYRNKHGYNEPHLIQLKKHNVDTKQLHDNIRVQLHVQKQAWS